LWSFLNAFSYLFGFICRKWGYAAISIISSSVLFSPHWNTFIKPYGYIYIYDCPTLSRILNPFKEMHAITWLAGIIVVASVVAAQNYCMSPDTAWSQEALQSLFYHTSHNNRYRCSLTKLYWFNHWSCECSYHFRKSHSNQQLNKLNWRAGMPMQCTGCKVWHIQGWAARSHLIHLQFWLQKVTRKQWRPYVHGSYMGISNLV